MNNIPNLIKNLAPSGFILQPTKQFYETISINRKRWGQIMRNEVQPDLKELHSIANYFEIPIIDLIK